MGNTPRLYDTLVGLLSQHRNWLDVRHMKTLAWMMVGLLMSDSIHLSEWAPWVESRAVQAQSTERRFARFLHNDRIEANALYGPLIRQALADWGAETLYLALDTSMLWNRYCLIRLSLIYRGRAVPLVWTVLEHASSSVTLAAYRELLDQADLLLPVYPSVPIVFLADRGFADTALMRYLTDSLGWHWHIRIKSSFWVYRKGREATKVSRITLLPGQALFWHDVRVTAQHYGPVHLALAHHRERQEQWRVLSDLPTSLETFDAYGLRFDIEESFLDDKSNGFQLESSQLDDAQVLERLCFVLAMTTLFLVCQGAEVVAQDRRRLVDPHWSRGLSYLKIGWRWVKRALVKRWTLISTFSLSGEPDPEPAIASRRKFFNQPSTRFTISFESFA